MCPSFPSPPSACLRLCSSAQPRDRAKSNSFRSTTNPGLSRPRARKDEGWAPCGPCLQDALGRGLGCGERWPGPGRTRAQAPAQPRGLRLSAGAPLSVTPTVSACLPAPPLRSPGELPTVAAAHVCARGWPRPPSAPEPGVTLAGRGIPRSRAASQRHLTCDRTAVCGDGHLPACVTCVW